MRSAALPLLLLASLAPASASAQASPNTTAAQLLFERAKELVRAKDYAAACPKFVESHRLDPRGGAILHAANCHEAEGKLATAWTEYDEALRLAIRDKRADREAVARERLAALAPKLGSVALRVTATDGLVIEIDGFAVAEPAWSSPIPLDRGDHKVVARATGRAPWNATVTVSDGASVELAVPALAPAAEATAPVSPPPPPPPPREAPPEDTGSSRRTVGLVIGGVGLVGVGVGAAFGIHAASIGDQSGKCTLGPARNGCPADAVSDQDRARTSGAISTIALAAGAGLTAIGAVLYLTAPKGGPRATIAPTVGGLSVQGGF